MIRRIVAVQGSIQLAAAVVAMRTRQAEQYQTNRNYEDHLIIHDLACPEDQCHEFVECIRYLGQTIHSWQSIRYVRKPEIKAILHSYPNDSNARQAALRDMLDIDVADEIFLGQNRLPWNHLLDTAYPSARLFCYGDGIGLNFTPEYYLPKKRNFHSRSPGWVRRVMTKLGGSKWSQPSPSTVPPNSVEFDRHYLLLPNHFDEKLAPQQFSQESPDDYLAIFEKFGDYIPEGAKDTIDRLNDSLLHAKNVVILLSSNFSETNRMAIDKEIEHYLNMATRCSESPDALLVIKPHPRDSHAKIARMADSAQSRFGAVLTLSDPWTFYFPFETLYNSYFSKHLHLRGRLRVVCASSASISLEYLYAQQCLLGFGKSIVEADFAEAWRTLRVIHEADLAKLTDHIRATLLPKGSTLTVQAA
jgi:Alpha-2,8-polysialyltransferase (POLYST)